MAARIKALLTWAGLLLLVALLFESGKAGLVCACIVVGIMVLNVLLSKRENLTRHNASLLVVVLVVVFFITFLDAVNLTRPLTHTDSFFKDANVDFDRQELAYSRTGQAMFKIGLGTEEFEKLESHYRQIAQDSQRDDGQYDWAYFELESDCIDRDTFFDSDDRVGGELFSSKLQKMETTDSDIVDSGRIKSGIRMVMEGFPEFDDGLGRCRTIIWYAPEVTREFYWFEKQQQGYMNP